MDKIKIISVRSETEIELANEWLAEGNKKIENIHFEQGVMYVWYKEQVREEFVRKGGLVDLGKM